MVTCKGPERALFVFAAAAYPRPCFFRIATMAY